MPLSDIAREIRKWRSLVWGNYDPNLGALDEVPHSDGAGGITWKATSGGAELPLNYLAGLDTRLAADAAHDITIAVGECRDDADTEDIVLASEITKRIDADWALGNNNGGLATGARSVANTPDADTWYHYFLIYDAVGDTVDAGWDTSLTATNLLADAGGNYAEFRRIWSNYVDSGNDIEPYTQHGNDCVWHDRIHDVNTTTTAGSNLATLTTPLGIVTKARVNIGVIRQAASDFYLITNPAETDSVPSISNYTGIADTSNVQEAIEHDILTNTSSQIRYRNTQANNDIDIWTLGYSDRRDAQSTGGATSSSGQWETIETRAISNVANEDFTWDESRYIAIKVLITDLIPATNGASVNLRLGSGNGATIYSSTNDYEGIQSTLTAVAWQNLGTTDEITLGNSVGSDANESLEAEIDIRCFRSTNLGAMVDATVTFINSSGDEQFRRIHGALDNRNVAVDTVQILPAAGLLEANGTIQIMGLVA